MEHFKTELLRIFSVLDDHLSGKHSGGVPREYLAGDGPGKFSIADMGTWPHIRGYKPVGIPEEDMSKFPSLLAWIARIAARPAVQEATCDKYDSEENPGAILRGGRER